MKIIALEKEKPTAQSSDFKKYRQKEAKVLWELYQKNVVREFYFRDDQKAAVLILETDSKEQAENELSGLPFVKNDLIEFELLPLKPYPGFERLFK